ncbi:hypothetical protein OG730_40340 [Streptomyces sp. NBC_01298]|nr:hypothetical protein OG730_40340 [Streptomyces sp. NBC_01298]
MSPAPVSAGLDGQIPFEKAGVSAHYSTHPDGVRRLGGVTA